MLLSKRSKRFVVVLILLAASLPVIFGRPLLTSAAVQDGAAVYNQKCAGCHGKDGKGMPMWKSKGQPDFTDAKYQGSVTDQQILASIRDGKGKFMPAFKGKLSDEQISSLVARVRAFGKR